MAQPPRRPDIDVEKIHVHDVEPSVEPGEHAILIAFRRDGQLCVYPRTNDAAGLARGLRSLGRALIEFPSIRLRMAGAEGDAT